MWASEESSYAFDHRSILERFPKRAEIFPSGIECPASVFRGYLLFQSKLPCGRQRANPPTCFQENTAILGLSNGPRRKNGIDTLEQGEFTLREHENPRDDTWQRDLSLVVWFIAFDESGNSLCGLELPVSVPLVRGFYLDYGGLSDEWQETPWRSGISTRSSETKRLSHWLVRSWEYRDSDWVIDGWRVLRSSFVINTLVIRDWSSFSR